MSGSSSQGPNEQEVHEKLRVTKEELKKLADDDNVIKHDKHQSANLLSRLSLGTFTDCDILITAVMCMQPSPSLSTNPPQTPHLLPTTYNLLPDEHTKNTHQKHVLPHYNDTRHKHTTSCTPPSTPMEPKPVQPEDRDTE